MSSALAMLGYRLWSQLRVRASELQVLISIPKKIERLKHGISDVPDVADTAFAPLITSRQIQVTTDFSVLQELDTVNICVPTPLRENRTPDMQFIATAVEQVAQHLHAEQLIVLESTTYPGTTEEFVLPMLTTHLNKKGADQTPKVGHDFYLAFSPERIEPGNSTYYMTNTPKIIGGVTPRCTQVAQTFYSQFISKTHIVSSSRTAEMVKLLENTFRSVNIGLINEVALICNRMDLDIWEIIDAAATKTLRIYAILSRDPDPAGTVSQSIHITSLGRRRNINTMPGSLNSPSEINSEMPKYVVDKISHALNLQRKPLNGSKLLILGVAYKKDIGDIRESPALEVIRLNS